MLGRDDDGQAIVEYVERLKGKIFDLLMCGAKTAHLNALKVAVI